MTLTDEVEKAAGERAVEILQNHGYPYAQVGIAREPIDATRARVIVRAEPGTIGFFGPVDIAGNRRVDDRIIRRRLAYAPGDLFRRSAIEQTQQRIGALGLFKSIEIRAQNIDRQPALTCPRSLRSKKGRHGSGISVLGYAAGERLGLDARISHLNVFGSAERIDLQGRVSRIERTAEVAFTQNDAWHPALSLSLQARHQEIDERAFFVMSRGGQAAVSWQWTTQFAEHCVLCRHARAERRRCEPRSAAGARGRNAERVVDRSRSSPRRRPTLLRARCRCTSSRPADGCRAPSTTSASPAMRATTGGLFDGRVVFASRVRLGSIDPVSGDADLPFLKRFFLGGSNEMRGWGTYELSPLSASGEPVGGKSLLTAIAEVRLADLQAPSRRGLRRGRQRVAGSVDDAAPRSPL